MKQIRKRLTYANVMSSIAVFLVLGGATAFAATKIGSGQLKANSVLTGKIKKGAVTSAKIKNNAITTSKLADKAVTGAKIDSATVGTVPNATNAVNAVNAQNASTVGGLHLVRFSLTGSNNMPKTEILNLNGLQLQASCSGGAITLTATTSVNGGEISAWANDASGGTSESEYEDEFDVGDTFTAPATDNSDVLGDGAYTGGDLRTVRFFYNEEDAIGNTDCLLNGYAIG